MVSKSEKLAVAGIVAFALALRLAHLAALRNDVLFQHPALDEEIYVEQGRRLAAGLPWEPGPFWQPPGVGTALSLCFRIFGDSLWWPRLLQAALGSALCLLVWILGRRLFSCRVGLLAAAITAIHGALIFSTGELLPAVWAATLALAALVALLDAPREPRLALAAGGLLGLCSLFTPTVLPFTLVAALHLWRTAERRGAAPAFAFAAVIPPLWAAWHNFSGSGELVLISTNGGVNFYLGNSPSYLDNWAIRPGQRWLELVQQPWLQARISEPARQSAWFVRQGLAFWSDHPLDALLLFLRKLALFFHCIELPRDTDIYAVREDSPVLRALVGARPSGLPGIAILPLALIGMGASRGRGPQSMAVWFVVSQALAYAFFIPAARYRIPCVAVLVLFAVAAGVKLWRAAWTTRRRTLPKLILATLVCTLPFPEVRLAMAGERDLYRGLANLRLGNADQAIVDFNRALRAAPDDTRPWIELGNALDRRGQPLAAARAWEAAVVRDLSNLDPARRAADVRESAGDRTGAIAVLQRSIDAHRHPAAVYARDHLRLASLHLQESQPLAAIDQLESAFAVNPAYARAHSRELMRQRGSHGSPEFWSRFDALMR